MAADAKGYRSCEGSTDDRQAMRDEDLWVTRQTLWSREHRKGTTYVERGLQAPEILS